MIPLSKPLIGKEEITAVTRVLESGNLAQGKVVEDFERQLATYHGYKFAITTSNGTTALHVALEAHNVKGGEVIGPDFTFIATANAPRFAGARPVFCDVSADNFNISPQSAKKMISQNTKAIIPVSLYGQAYPVDEVKEVAGAVSVPIISDNCQAIGAKYKGKRNFGDSCSVLSFYPTKNLTTGEGGAILTDNAELADTFRLIRNHGMRNRYEYVKLGYNFRLTEIAAAIGLEQLKKLDKFTTTRRENAKILGELLVGVRGIILPIEEKYAEHVFHQYTIRVSGGKRNALKQHLDRAGIGCAVYYPAPLHTFPLFSSERSDGGKNTAQVAAEVLSIPVNPALGEGDLQTIASAVKSFFK